jgi:hypothetical protein
MAYTKTEWTARQGTGLNRFIKTQETEDAVNLTNEPLTVTNPGTPFSEENMNHIEQGIEDAHEGIAAESQAREHGDNELAQAISAEALARENADADTLSSAKSHSDSSISQTNENLQSLQLDFNAWIGRGGYLDAFDFNTARPAQEDLTNYALSQISSISDPINIWNGTKVINLFNGFLWILTNTRNTDPPVFEWADQGPGDVAVFGKNIGGVIVGADPDMDPLGSIIAQPNGKGKIDLDAIVQMLFDKEHPVGDVVEQMPGALSPIEKGWVGIWLLWNDRASMYRLRQAVIPSYTAYTPGANYAAGAVVMWHLDGDDYAFFQAKAAITSATEQLDPVKWDQLKEGVVIERKDILDINPWTDADLAIGQQITGGEYDGYWVEEVIVYGGKFFSAEGGNRPPFITGGVAEDVQRRIFAGIQGQDSGIRLANDSIMVTGAFVSTKNIGSASGTFSDQRPAIEGIDSSRVVPTGAENSVRTFSELVWRRVA